MGEREEGKGAEKKRKEVGRRKGGRKEGQEKKKKEERRKRKKTHLKPYSFPLLQPAFVCKEAKGGSSLPKFCKVSLGRENTGQTVWCRRFCEIAPGTRFATISWLFFIALDIKQSCKVLHKTIALTCTVSALPGLCGIISGHKVWVLLCCCCSFSLVLFLSLLGFKDGN